MRTRLSSFMALLALPLLAGCAAAAAGAAGAAGAIAYSERGAETQLEASLAEITRATEDVFADLGLTITERDVEDGGDEVELTASSGEMRVVVDIEREGSGLTSVEVTAREGTLQYDRDYAEDVLRRIMRAL